MYVNIDSIKFLSYATTYYVYLNFAEMMFLLRRRFDLIFEATDEAIPPKCAKNEKECKIFTCSHQSLKL